MLSVVTIYREEDTYWLDGLGSSLPKGTEWLVCKTKENVTTMPKAVITGASIIDDITVKYFDWHYKIDNFSFSKAKNAILSQVNTEWVLVLDSDDRVIRDFTGILELIKNAPDDVGGFYVNVISSYEGSTEVKTLQQVRLFRSRFRYRYRVHEQVEEVILETGNKILKTNIPILHLGYNNLSLEHYGAKLKRNIKLLIRDLIDYPSNEYLHFMLSEAYAELRGHGAMDYIDENGAIVKKQVKLL